MNLLWPGLMLLFCHHRVSLNQPLESAINKFGEHFHDCWAMKKVSKTALQEVGKCVHDVAQVLLVSFIV